ncbi:hypothetical protein [Ornithobacterium rhinotracheale]|uniref:hypothetical protein n=1 Tax=Ornithobacterium rhinotracheale TaxID=28251 RepID=UPI001FF57768|nr:hypothetical protein [Ornithobacterium rhinotracheale]MCK0201362.1 hypothetical protein [Ornithobacterium rhinotracheale]
MFLVTQRKTWIDYYVKARGATSVKFATERGRTLKYRILEGNEIKSSGEITDSNYMIEFPDNENEKILRIFDAIKISVGHTNPKEVVTSVINSEIINSIDFSKSRLKMLSIDKLILPDFIVQEGAVFTQIGLRDYSNWKTLRPLHVRYVDEFLDYAYNNTNINQVGIEGAHYTEIGEKLIKKLRERGCGVNDYGSSKIEMPHNYNELKSFYRKNNIGKDFGKIVHEVGEKIYG